MGVADVVDMRNMTASAVRLLRRNAILVGRKATGKKMCRSKTLREVKEGAATEQVWTLGTLRINKTAEAWRKTIDVGGKQVSFKIDTGADVSAVPAGSVLAVKTVTPTTTKLYGAGGQPLKVIGKIHAVLKCNGNTFREELYVVEDLEEALLGRRASLGLKLVQLLQPVTEDSREKYQAKFPELFAGIGEMQGEYHIKLKPEARPVSVTTSRRVPLPLLGKVEAQLKEMEGNGIIRKVEEPTPWCSAMVVVPKSNGEVRICVDLTNLNKAVEREKLLPNHEEFRRKDKEEKRKQTRSYNIRHKASDRGEMTAGSPVWVTMPGTTGRLVKKNNSPRSWVVDTPRRQLVRNTHHLIPVPATREDHADIEDNEQVESKSNPPPEEEIPGTVDTSRDEEGSVNPDSSEEKGVFSRYGRRIVKPVRYRN
ncbi:hypothetical protein MTO96_040469 [Rhipicephalus appendiculatus]